MAPKTFALAYAAKWSPLRFVGSFLQRRLAFILRVLNPHSGELVLDIGCGSGEYMELQKDDVRVIGVDYSREMLQIAKSKLKKRKRKWLVQADARTLPIRDNAVDHVIMVAVLDYVADVAGTLKEAIRPLCISGDMVFTIPKSPSPFSFLRRGIGLYIRQAIFKLPPIINWVTREELIDMLKKESLTIVTIGVIQGTMWVVKVRKAN